MKYKTYLILLTLFVLMVTSCSNQKEWEEALTEWQEAVEARDKQIIGLHEEIADLESQVNACQMSLDTLAQAKPEPTPTPKPTPKPTQKPTPKPKATSKPKRRGCFTLPGFFAGLTEEDFDRGVSYLNTDRVAFNRLLSDMSIFRLKKGLKVHIEKNKMFSGKVKFRPDGETAMFWTFSEAVDCN